MRRALILGAGLLWALPASSEASPTNAGELTNPLETVVSCQACHLFANPAAAADEPNQSPGAWLGSMMGNSARDPVFWAGAAIAHQDDPADTELCVRCHVPRAYLDGRGDIIAMDEMTLDEREGIGCDLCHRMVDDGVTPPGNAQWTIDDVLDGAQVPKRGPWAYEDTENHNHPSSDENDLQASSRFCGTCHDVTTVRGRVDDAGMPMGFAFNEQRTYSEWANSVFANTASADARSCQDCHMPEVADVAGCNIFLTQGKTHETGGRLHNFVGANRFMMELLADEQAAMTVPEVPAEIFDNAIANLDAFLPTAATLEVEFPSAVDLDAGISDLAVRVTNESGHKLPSGYSEGRVMFLELTARYDGELIYSSGLWDQASGEIQDDAQVRRYEGIADEFATGQRNHLLLNDHWVSDTRLPPRGLREDLQTDPVNSWYVPQNGIWPHWDDHSYDFPAAQVSEHESRPAAEIDLQVRLLYVINTAEYIDELADANVTNAAGADLANLFASKGGASPVVIAEASTTVPLMGLEELPSAESETETSADAESEATGEETAAAGDEGGGGCSCRSDAKGGAPTAGLAMLALFGLRRRRRGRV